MTAPTLKSLYILSTSIYAVAVVEAINTPVSAWTPDKVTALIAAVFTGLALLLTAVGGVVVLLIQLKTKTEQVHIATVESTRVTQGVHDAVNGANSALLGRIDRLTTKVAALTGDKSDIIESEAAHAEGLDADHRTQRDRERRRCAGRQRQ